MGVLLSNSRRRSKPEVKHQLLGCCFLLICGVFVYIVTAYSLDSDGSITHLVDTFRTIQISLGESYRHLTNPESSHEIAEIVTEMYELLADMGYYDRSVIGRPPHTMGINRTLAIELGYSPEAIETMELLPYLNLPAEEFPLTWMEGEGSEFILEGAFTDLRSDEALKMCRDPMGLFMHGDSSRVFNEDEEPYMHSEYICFSSLGVNGMGAILVLDVKNCRFRRTLMISAHLP
jgi:hypothetical protein